MYKKYRPLLLSIIFSVSLVLILFIISIFCMYLKYVHAYEVKEEVYIVNKGDSLYSIAERYKHDYESTENVISRIRFRNNINRVVYPGQKVYVPME